MTARPNDGTGQVLAVGERSCSVNSATVVLSDGVSGRRVTFGCVRSSDDWGLVSVDQGGPEPVAAVSGGVARVCSVPAHETWVRPGRTA